MLNDPETAPAPDTNINEWVEIYIACRDWIKAAEERHKKELAPKKAAMEVLKGKLQKFLDDTKQEGGKTEAGTFFKSLKHSASLSDAAEFRRFVIGGEHWDLLDWKANVTAVLDFAEENQGELPPGVKVTPKEDVNVRRPTEK